MNLYLIFYAAYPVIIIYLIFLMSVMKKPKKINLKGKSFSPFKTKVYKNISSSTKTNNDTLSFIKSKYDDLGAFKNDVQKNVINSILFNNSIYRIVFSHEDNYYCTFKISNQCNEFSFGNCENSRFHNILSKEIHILGIKL